MEMIEKKLEQLKKAITTLKKVIELENITPDPENIHRDAKIKRFEYTSELFWKFIKVYLERIHGIKIATPKQVYREAMAAEILTEDETKHCIKMVETRNMTSHLYNEKKAEKIAQEIDSHFLLMQKIINRLSKELSK